jgi:hypothetical protein
MSLFYSDFSKTVYSNPSYIAIVEILEYVIFIVILYKYNPFSVSSQYKNALTLFVALFYVVLFYFLRENISLGLLEGQGETGFLIKFISTVGLFFLSVLLIKKVGGYLISGNISGLFRSGLTLLIIVVALAGVYTIFKPLFLSAQKAEKGSVLRFFINVFFFLPCILLSVVDYVKFQYRITTKPVWLLLAAEVVLVTLWFLIPLALHAYTTKNGIQLVKEPQYLNKEVVVGTFEQLYNGRDDKGRDDKGRDDKGRDDSQAMENPDFNYHYSLSAWFYLNPQPPNTSPAYNKYTTILNYGNKPAVEFNGSLNSLRVLVETEPGKRVELFETKKVLFQKWNNLVLNYDRGTMDVFLNGVLVGSKASVAPYMTYENIQIGSNNGLQGGISNVVYYQDNLSRSYIETLYKALKGKAEPFI